MCNMGSMFLQQSKTQSDMIKLLYKLTIQWTHLDNNIRITKSMVTTQELGFLDRQNYQLCFQHWIRKYRTEKIPHARIQDSRSHLELFGHMDFKWKN